MNIRREHIEKGQKNFYQTIFICFSVKCLHIWRRICYHTINAKKVCGGAAWIEEQEMMDLTAIAQSSPGAIAVNASILVGYRVAGVIGALITVLGTILPPLSIVSVISFFYTAFRDNAIVNMAMSGMLAGVAAVICDVVITMGTGILQKKRILPIAVLVASFLAVRFWKVNIILIIIICAVIGAVDTLYMDRKERHTL